MRTVICFQDIKIASLYFDRVLPMAFRQMAGTGSDIVVEFPEPIPSRALINVVFDKVASEGLERYTDIGRIIDGWDFFSKEARDYMEADGISSTNINYKPLWNSYMKDVTKPGNTPLRKLFAEYANSLGFRQTGILIPPSETNSDEMYEDAVVSLCKLQLIDAERAHWDQIIELRSDINARVRLQCLRAFAQTNYQGKSISFIEDDLLSRIDEYHQVASKHGFALVTGTLSTLMDSSTLLTVAGASLAAAYLGGPMTAVSAAACIELGKAAVEFAKTKRSMVDWAKNHPLAYIIEAKARSKNSHSA